MTFADARRKMVDNQVRPNGVTDLRVIAAMMEVPRERFVPPERAFMAYMDGDLPVARLGLRNGERALLKPMVLARMLQVLDLAETDRVLDIGGATGYSAAVLARLVAHVTALEETADLAGVAACSLAGVGASTVETVAGPLEAGWPSGAPYDAILINGAIDSVPATLLGQLATNGRLVAVVGSGVVGRAMLYRGTGANASGAPVFDANAPVLSGFAKPPAFVF